MTTDKLNLMFDPRQFAAEFAVAPNDEAAPRSQADATMWLQGNVGGAGTGFPWGSGQMNFQGCNYPFRVSGLSIEEAGTASIYATGRVMGLRKASDLSGTYRASSARGTMADPATCLQNERGVVIQLVATDASTAASRSVNGVRMRLNPQT
jgi:outer membrane immunogenic protein